jgi:hypothetical protein
MKTALIRMTMFDLGKGNDLFEVAKRTKIWIPELAKAIKNEQLRIFHNINVITNLVFLVFLTFFAEKIG